MKIIVSLLIGLFLFASAAGEVSAQKRKVTIILLRHAEKDLSGGGANPDPDLSPEGRRRAERLVKVVNKYKPMRIYATEYKRAQSTVAPLSKKRNLPVKTYDAGQLKELAAEITSFKKGRRIVVVGHSNTTPALANLLVKADQYRPLDESEYDQIWLIRIKKGKVRAELLRY